MRSLFFIEYIKNFRVVGAVAPSSRFLARKMLESVDFEHTKVIVEYGPGTGIFTAELAKRIKPGTKIIAIETNQAFYRILRDEYVGVKDVEIINDSAENVKSILKERGIKTPDCVVSGLPFTALPAEVSQSILESTADLLDKQGAFITFQYTLFKRELFESYFGNIKTTREFRNLPPAYVLYCKK